MKFKLGIRNKILLSSILVGVIPGIIVMMLVYHYGTGILRENIGADFEEITKGATREINDILTREIDEAYHLSLSPPVREAVVRANARYDDGSSPDVARMREQEARWKEMPPDDPAVKAPMEAPISKHMGVFKSHNPEEYINLTLIDSRGLVVAAVEKPRRFYWGDDPMWQEGMRQRERRAFFSDIVDIGGDRFALELSVPVTSPKGEPVGVMVVEFRLEELFAAINLIQVGKTGHANLVRSDGMMLIDPLIPPMSLRINEELLRLISSRSSGWVVADDEHGGANAIIGYATVSTPQASPGSFGGHRWYAFIGLDPSETYAPFRAFLFKLAFIGLILIFIISAVSHAIAKRIVTPLQVLQDGAHMIGQGRLDYTLDICTGDEIESLASDFNQMTESLRESRRILMDWNSQLEEEIRKRTYDLRIAVEELKRSDRMKSEFLATMSHELRTPLNSIIGFSEVLTDEFHGKLSEKQQRYVGNILLSGQHLLKLINDILDLSKVEAGKMDLSYSAFSMGDFFRNILAAFRPQSQQKHIDMTCEVDGIDFITADLTRLRQIVYNIVSNAVKFTPDHGSITLSARKKRKQGKGFIEIAISDTGIGISQGNQQIIFDAFRQVDSSFTRKYEGTGLGLALTKKLVELHGGKIWVESEEGKGSTFFIILPDRAASAADAATPSERTETQLETHAPNDLPDAS